MKKNMATRTHSIIALLCLLITLIVKYLGLQKNYGPLVNFIDRPRVFFIREKAYFGMSSKSC